MRRRSAACELGIGLAACLLVAAALLAPSSATGDDEGEAEALKVRPEVPVTAIDFQQERAHNSPTLAVDPTDERFVVAASRIDAPEFDCALHVSGDGGGSWLPAEPIQKLPEGAERCYGPEAAFDADGRLYVLFVGLHGEGNEPMGAFLMTSDDRGRSFTAPQQVLEGHRYMVRLALDPDHGDHGRLHLVWVKAKSAPPTGGFGSPPNPIMTAHSDDGGQSWSQPVQVSDPDRDRVVAPTVALGADGAVHVAYYDLHDDVRNYQGLEGPAWEGTWSLVVSSSNNRGQRFDRHGVVDDDVVHGERVMLIFTTSPPALTADRDGRLVAAWPDARHGDRDVLARRSLDGGENWQAPVRVNDDEIGNGRAQFLPQVDVSPGGRVDVIFYDRRDDPDDVHQHVSYAHSTDGGATFSSNVRVTAEPSDSRTGPTYPLASAQGLVEFGSRIAVASQPSGLLAAWTDTRLPSRGLLHQDVFVTEILVPSTAPARAGSRWSWLVLASAGVGGLLLVVLVLTRRRRQRRRRIAPAVIAAIAIALVGTGCSPPGADAEALPPSATRVPVELYEYGFDVPEVVPAGRAVFEVTNVGEAHHEVVLVALPDDFPSLAEHLGNSTRRQAFATLMHLDPREPGERGVFAMDLAPGRYGLLCFVEDDDGRQHVHKGMLAEFRVAEPDPTGRP